MNNGIIYFNSSEINIFENGHFIIYYIYDSVQRSIQTPEDKLDLKTSFFPFQRFTVTVLAND